MDSQQRKTHRGPGIKHWRLIIRNLPFDTTVEGIREWALPFGHILEVVLPKCKDKRFPNSCAGFCFVQFSRRCDAEKAIERLNFTEFNGRKVAVDWALDKDNYITKMQERESAKELTLDKDNYITKMQERESAKELTSDKDNYIPKMQERESTKKKPGKDKRNLFLMRVSLVRPGTAQANGMSETDAKLRQRLMELAKNKLKNLTMFVSPTRLVVHNIPFSWTDAQLKGLCLEAIGGRPPSSISECRIMRQLKGRDEKGRPVLGKSCGFGFVSFTEHALALNCLRKLNNSTRVFTNERRPIIEFSIENLNALRAKERRHQQKEAKSDGNEKVKKGGRLEDDEALAKTKREMMAGGKKWLPKKFDAKIRHKRVAKKRTGKKSMK